MKKIFSAVSFWLLLVCFVFQCPQNIFASEVVGLSIPEGVETDYYYVGKPELDELVEKFPKQIEAEYSDGSRELTDVKWETPDDYINKDRSYYAFEPVLDGVELPAESLPYLVVWIDNTGKKEKGLLGATSNASHNEEQAFYYMLENMGLNQAACAGLLANIKAESGFDPNAIGDRGTSYGICQWHNTRWNDLINYCDENGYDWTTLDGQLRFLEYELRNKYKRVWNYIISVDNSDDGAYDAAYYFCYKFEIPANTERVAVSRGRVARDTYWPRYCDRNRRDSQEDRERHLEWLDEDGKSYWYENNVRQGTVSDERSFSYEGTVRGREIYDPASDGWYWLDACYDGAKAVNKEVYMPYVFQTERDFSAEEIERYSKESAAGAAGNTEKAQMDKQVKDAIMKKAGKWVRYDENGKMMKGWVRIEGELASIYPHQAGNVYYYDRKTGLMAKGETVIDGKTYNFDKVTGAMK